MKRLRIVKAGESLGVALPAEVLARLGVIEGDTVFLTTTPEGHVLTAPDAELQEQLRVAREVMERNRDVLRELAKS
jgi:putative addiction module antidote